MLDIPNNLFGLKVQIDSVKQVNKIDDYARKFVVHIQWINQAFSWINLIRALCKQVIFGNQLCESEMRNTFKNARDFSSMAINFIRTHVLMSNHIVGLLSPNYQGDQAFGSGKRREVIERESSG